MSTPEPFISKVRIEDFRSIAKCEVELGRVTFLVGRNGAGKSNFLDAIRFVRDSLTTSLDLAVRDRGGTSAVLRKSRGHPRNLAIELELNFPLAVVRYGFEMAARREGYGFEVVRERMDGRRANGSWFGFHIERGEVKKSSVEAFPKVASDALALVRASSVPEFAPVFEGLVSMGFYSLQPTAMKDVQSPDAGDLLHADGSNIASVIGRMKPEDLRRVQAFLGQVIPGVKSVERTPVGPKETLKFHQTVRGDEHAWGFYANSMSDGTLRTLGILTAVTQEASRSGRVRVVGIEEPETALHPAAAGALVDAIREASTYTQIVVTTHSPDLLDHEAVDPGWIRVVVSEEGVTRVAKLDEASRDAVKQHLYTPGELLRLDQLAQDPSDLRSQEQLRLFSGNGDGRGEGAGS